MSDRPRSVRSVAAAAFAVGLAGASPCFANNIHVAFPALPEADAMVGPVRLEVRDVRFGPEPLPSAPSANDPRPRYVGWLWKQEPTPAAVAGGWDIDFHLKRWTVGDVVGETLLRGLRAGGVYAMTLGAPATPILRADIERFWCSAPETPEGVCAARIVLSARATEDAAPGWGAAIEASVGAREHALQEDDMVADLLERVARQARGLAPALVPGLPSASPPTTTPHHPEALVLVDRKTRDPIERREDLPPEDRAGRLEVVRAARPFTPLSRLYLLALLDEPLLSERFWTQHSDEAADRPTEGGDELVVAGWGLTGGAITAAALLPASVGASVDWCWGAESACGPPPMVVPALIAGGLAASGIPMVVDGAIRQRNKRQSLEEPRVDLGSIVLVPRLWDAVQAYNARLTAE